MMNERTVQTMTDNKIVKALEYCFGNIVVDCCKCAYHKCDCVDGMIKDALDLINRQKAEIEKWKKNCDELYEQMSERQKLEVDIARRMGKAEAIKEFAERLKDMSERFWEENFVSEETIDNLVKEMVGDV